MSDYKFETLQLHVGQEQADPATDARAVPIYATTSYVFHDCAHAAARFGLTDAGNIYGRLTNSTQDVLEKRVAALEGGVAALALASGAAAITYVLEALGQNGGHFVAQKTIYGGSYNLLAHTLPGFGITADFVNIHDLKEVESAIRPETRAIVCTHASNLTGDAVDLARVGALAHAHGVLLVVDASQSAGVLPIDMERMHIDVLCFTGHKSLMGPQGTGGLCLRGDPDILPWKVGGTGVQTFSERQPEQLPVRLEAGTLNGHGIAGLDVALDFIAVTGMETIRAHETALMRRFYEGVRDIPGVTVYGDFTHERTAVVALNIADLDSGEVADALAEDYGIATRSGAHCAPRLHRALGTEGQGAVRFSFGWYNTEEETDAAIRAVEELAR